jgi:hypothetical protein
MNVLIFLAVLSATHQELPLIPTPTPASGAQTWKPVVGQPAPEPGLRGWIDEETKAPEQEQRVESTSIGGMLPISRKSKTLAELSDHVVIVHTFAWDDAAATENALPLVRDLLAANADRRLAAIGIANAVDKEAARTQARSLQLEHPIAMQDFAQPGSTYVDLGAHPACYAFVVGRGGGLVWSGDPLEEEKGLLAAVKDALLVPEVVRIAQPLHAKLAKGLGEYYAGRLSRALALAAEERKQAEKPAGAACLADAKLLEKTALEAQHDWLRKLSEAAASKDATVYVALLSACQTGFARGEIAKDLVRLEKEARKDGFFEMRLLDSKKYLAMLDERPVLFPARKDAAGDKFAKKLESFVRSTPNSTEETRTAQALADRYRFLAR